MKETIVISGSSSGIGKKIAEKFLSAGNMVYGFDVEKANINHKCYKHIIHDVQDDFSNKLDFMNIDDVNIIISNAGCFDEKKAIDVNLLGAIKFTEYFLKSKALKSILFIASASARNGSEFPYYVASKAGLVGYMKNLAGKVAKRKITCNSLSPGGVNTNSNSHILENPVLKKMTLDETLLGKWAEESEIADFAYFMTTINSSMTGEDILVDNGEMLKSNFIW